MLFHWGIETVNVESYYLPMLVISVIFLWRCCFPKPVWLTVLELFICSLCSGVCFLFRPKCSICTAVLVDTNSSICFYQSLSFDSFTGSSRLGWHLCSFKTFSIPAHALCFSDEPAFYVPGSVSLAAFNIFSLVYTFSILTII